MMARRGSALKTPSPKKVKTSKEASFTRENALASEEETGLDDCAPPAVIRNRESLQGIHLTLMGIKNTITGVEKMLKAEFSKKK